MESIREVWRRGAAFRISKGRGIQAPATSRQPPQLKGTQRVVVVHDPAPDGVNVKFMEYGAAAGMVSASKRVLRDVDRGSHATLSPEATGIQRGVQSRRVMGLLLSCVNPTSIGNNKMSHGSMLKARRQHQKTRKLLDGAAKQAKRLAKLATAEPVVKKEKVKAVKVKKEKVKTEKVKKVKLSKEEMGRKESKKGSSVGGKKGA
ncbi:MAG: hypothetical protein ABI440_12365 [Casimicrobiaceae bacterium]